jgi:hypothetical protein
MKAIKFDHDNWSWKTEFGVALRCGNCGWVHTHQQAPRVYSDPYDGEIVDIPVSCEHCDVVSMLRIRQYEGVTYIGWEDNGTE